MSRLHRAGLVVALVALMVLVTLPSHAQDTPPANINVAVQDLSQRLGIPLQLSNIHLYTWSGELFPDTSLGCPQPGVAYASVATPGIRYNLTYQNITYDYRVSGAGNTVILCNSYPVGQAPALNIDQPITVDPLPPAIPVEPVAPTTPAIGACPADQLVIGSQAQSVLTQSLLNVRSDAGLTHPVVAQIQPGGTVSVLSGPLCDTAGIPWWQIQIGDVVGWAAGGDGVRFFLTSLDGPVIGDLPAPSDSGVTTFACAGSAPSRLASGGQARVREILTAPVNIRTEPALTSPVIDQFQRGNIVDILGGPVCGTQQTIWWQTQSNVVTGWVAETSGAAYLLEPYTVTTQTSDELES